MVAVILIFIQNLLNVYYITLCTKSISFAEVKNHKNQLRFFRNSDMKNM